MEMHIESTRITQDDLAAAKYWIKAFYNGGVKKFAKDNGWPQSTVSAVLNGARHNPYIIKKAGEVAVEIAAPIANNFRFLKNLKSIHKDTDGRSLT